MGSEKRTEVDTARPDGSAFRARGRSRPGIDTHRGTRRSETAARTKEGLTDVVPKASEVTFVTLQKQVRSTRVLPARLPPEGRESTRARAPCHIL